MKKKLTVIGEQGGGFVDSADCGSHITWHINVDTTGELYGRLKFTDCDKMITWQLRGDNIHKITNAIGMLKDVKAAMKAALKKSKEAKKLRV